MGSHDFCHFGVGGCRGRVAETETRSASPCPGDFRQLSCAGTGAGRPNLHDESRERGISIAIYPATGEVCDLTNGGGVIGYLLQTPLSPGVPVPCDLTLYRFGHNFVCSVRVQGEIFLYPAFSMNGDATLTAFVGQENDGNSDENVSWSRLRLDVLEQPVAA